jgi:hypothetical protein
MAYEDQTKRSKVVVETPTTRREVTRTEREYPPTRNGNSTAAIAALVILAIAVIGLIGLLFWNMRANQNADNLATQQPTPQTIVQQPAQQAPVIVQQPAPATQPAPVIITAPAPATAPATGAANVPDDSSIQSAVDNKLHSDSTLSTLDITASVLNGKVLLVGSVKTAELKKQIEKTVRSVKGVTGVDNQLLVTAS